MLDNGSSRPESYGNLKRVAAALSRELAWKVAAVSFAYSDQLPADQSGGETTLTLEPFIREHYARGVREFCIVPFIIADGGGIAARVRQKLKELEQVLPGVSFKLTSFLFDPASGTNDGIASILYDQVEEVIRSKKLMNPSVIVVDHGSFRREAIDVRNKITQQLADLLGTSIAAISPASMERREGEEYDFNEPLLEKLLRTDGFNQGDIVLAQLFLSPGKHAGPDGDIESICRAAEEEQAGLRIHRTELLGTHPSIVGQLAELITPH